MRSGAAPSALPHTDAVHPEQGQGNAGVHAGSQVGPRTVAVRDGDKIVSDILHINFIVNIIQKQSLDALSGQRGLSCCLRYDDNILHLYSILSQCLDVNRISNWWWAKRGEDIKIDQGRLKTLLLFSVSFSFIQSLIFWDEEKLWTRRDIALRELHNWYQQLFWFSLKRDDVDNVTGMVTTLLLQYQS